MNKDILRISALALGILAYPGISSITEAKAAEIKISGEGRVDCSGEKQSPASISEQILPGSSLNIGTPPDTLSLKNENGNIGIFRINTGTPVKLFDISDKRSGEFLPKGELRVKDPEFSDGPYRYDINVEAKKTSSKGNDKSVKVTVVIDCNIKPSKAKK